MARAAVKAKQQAKAKAQPAKAARAHGRRRHSGGGNPNQQLFFMKLRRGQKWLYALLAVIFAITFVGVGVGSGTNGLSGLYSGIFGGGGDDVSKAKDEIKDHPAKGYLDLARAYETKGDSAQAVSALHSYLALKKKDANAWAELGGLELSQAQTFATQYQSAAQAAQLADPSAPFLPSGTLATAVGTNAAYQQASQDASSQTSALYQKATTSLNSAVSDYQTAVKIQPRNATRQQELAVAAEQAGNAPVAIKAWKMVNKLEPNSPQHAQIEARIKQLSKQAQASAGGSQPQASYGK
jgi:hypothetical protein